MPMTHVLAIHGTPLSSNENKQPHVTLLSQWTSPLCQLLPVFAIPGIPLGGNENSQTHVTLLGQWTSSFPKLKPLQNGDNSHHNWQNAQHLSLCKPHQTKKTPSLHPRTMYLRTKINICLLISINHAKLHAPRAHLVTTGPLKPDTQRSACSSLNQYSKQTSKRPSMIAPIWIHQPCGFLPLWARSNNTLAKFLTHLTNADVYLRMKNSNKWRHNRKCVLPWFGSSLLYTAW